MHVCGGSPSFSQISHHNSWWQSSIYLIFSTLARITICLWESPNADYKLTWYLLAIPIFAVSTEASSLALPWACACTDKSRGNIDASVWRGLLQSGFFSSGELCWLLKEEPGRAGWAQTLRGDGSGCFAPTCLSILRMWLLEVQKNLSWPLDFLCSLLAGSTEGQALFLNGFHVHIVTSHQLVQFLCFLIT